MSPRAEVEIDAEVTGRDPPPGDLEQAHPSHMGHQRPRGKPDLPAALPCPGAPVLALPIQHEAFVLWTDLCQRLTPDRVTGLLAMADCPLLVVRPFVPPPSPPSASAQNPAQPEAEECL